VAAGTCTITASQGGNAAYAAATSVSQSFTVTASLKSQTITFNAIAAQNVGVSLTVRASASSGLPVSFSIIQNGNCSISGSVVKFLNPGDCGVIANQSGNSTYAAAPAVGQVIVVN
jgi:Cu/Zn superoxide dismutase